MCGVQEGSAACGAVIGVFGAATCGQYPQDVGRMTAAASAEPALSRRAAK